MALTNLTATQEKRLNSLFGILGQKSIKLGTFIKSVVTYLNNVELGVLTAASVLLTTPKIADGGTGVTVTSADQTHAAPVVTIPDIGDAADEFVMKDTEQIIANKTFIHGFASHDYGAAAADWVLSASEAKKKYLIVTNASGAVNLIVPAGSQFIEYIVLNTSGQALTVKSTSGTGIVIASTKRAMVYFDATNMARLTADA